jgi:hypothetical protein
MGWSDWEEFRRLPHECGVPGRSARMRPPHFRSANGLGFQGGLEPGFCLAPASSCPAHRRIAPLLAHCLAGRQIPTSRELERLRSRVEQAYESNSGGVAV